MTGSNTSLRQVRALYFYARFSGSRTRSFSWLSLSRHASVSRFMWLQRLSWGRWLRVMLLAGGMAYATTSMLGEFLYAQGQVAHTPVNAIDDLRQARIIFPLSD